VFWAIVALLVVIGMGFFLRANSAADNHLARVQLGLVRRFRAILHRLPLPASARRAMVLIVGVIVLVIGMAMIFLPGPAIVVIPAGLAILATEFEWAQRLLDRGRTSVRKLLHHA